MDLIVSLIAIVAAVLAGASKLDLFGVAEKWFITKDLKRRDLWETYALVCLVVICINLIVLIVRQVIELDGGSFFPTYITRTKLEWFMGAVLSSFVIWLSVCCSFNDYYNYRLDRNYFSSPAYKKKCFLLQGFNVAMFLLTLGYQVYFYGWGLGF